MRAKCYGPAGLITWLYTGRIQSVTLPEIPLPTDGDGDILGEFSQKAGSKIPQVHTRRVGEKRRVRRRTRAFPFDDGDEASNQSSSIGDLKIRGEFSDESESVSESEEDEDQRIMNEALEATSGRMEVGGSEDEESGEGEIDVEDIDPDQILGLD